MPVTADEAIREVLGLSPVAVVGCSRSPRKAAHRIPKYMRDHGYEIIPVNPYADEILGQQAYPTLKSVEKEVSIVNVFRPSKDVPDIVAAAIDRGDVSVVWLQLGIRHPTATERAEEAGFLVVEDRCMKVEHRRVVQAP